MRAPILREPVIFSLLAAVFSALLWAAGPPDTPIQVSLSSKTWTTVPLPATALGITEYDGVLWVAGADEMLARSGDQGRTWQMVHFKKGGELLFAVAFAGKDGWAMGSLGREFHSDDAGAHWKQMSNAPVSVMRLVAADSRHLMASSPQDFLVSSNGGKSWSARGVPIPNQKPPLMYPVQGIAMPDRNHAGALLGLSPGSQLSSDSLQRFVATSDGGKTWRATEFPARLRIVSLSSDANGYEAWGSLYSGSSTKSEIFRSPDGVNWSTTPNQSGVYRCHRSTCLLSGISGWVQQDHGVAAYWKTIRYPKTVNHWAATSGVLCVVGVGLQCVQGQLLAAAPAPSPANRAASSHTEAPGKVTPAHCLRCAPPKYPQLGRAVWIRGDVVLHAFVDKNGRIQDLTLLAAPSAGLAQVAMQTVRGWVYQPRTINGRPVETETQIRVHFTLPR